MRVLYTAGPYRDDRGMYYVWQNIEQAKAVARELWLMGFAVICPHANTQMMDGNDTHEMFLQGDFEMVKRCDGIVVLPGWERSEGTRREIVCAKANGVPVYHWPQDEAQLRMTIDDEREAYA